MNDKLAADILQDVREQTRALIESGDIEPDLTVEELQLYIELEPEVSDDLVWSLFREHWWASGFPQTEFLNVQDHAQAVAQWAISRMIDDAIKTVASGKLAHQVTMEYGEEGRPGFIRAVYEVVDGDRVHERDQVTSRMINQLVRGGWRVAGHG